MQGQIPLECTWMVAVIAAAVACFTLLQLSRDLPAQNILLIAVGLLAGQALVELILSRIDDGEVTGPLGVFLVGASLLWLAVALGARWLSEVILQPCRRQRYYGFGLIGLSVLGVMLFQMGWPRLRPEPAGLQTVLILMGVRGFCTAMFLIGLAPWFIRKRPVPPGAGSEFAQQPQKQAQHKADEKASR